MFFHRRPFSYRPSVIHLKKMLMSCNRLLSVWPLVLLATTGNALSTWFPYCIFIRLDIHSTKHTPLWLWLFSRKYVQACVLNVCIYYLKIMYIIDQRSNNDDFPKSIFLLLRLDWGVCHPLTADPQTSSTSTHTDTLSHLLHRAALHLYTQTPYLTWSSDQRYISTHRQFISPDPQTPYSL